MFTGDDVWQILLSVGGATWTGTRDALRRLSFPELCSNERRRRTSDIMPSRDSDSVATAKCGANRVRPAHVRTAYGLHFEESRTF